MSTFRPNAANAADSARASSCSFLGSRAVGRSFMARPAPSSGGARIVGNWCYEPVFASAELQGSRANYRPRIVIRPNGGFTRLEVAYGRPEGDALWW